MFVFNVLYEINKKPIINNKNIDNEKDINNINEITKKTLIKENNINI